MQPKTQRTGNAPIGVEDGEEGEEGRPGMRSNRSGPSAGQGKTSARWGETSAPLRRANQPPFSPRVLLRGKTQSLQRQPKRLLCLHLVSAHTRKGVEKSAPMIVPGCTR
jgi:hypothetical protein